MGRTRFCTEPAEMGGRVPAFGGTKNPDLARIVAAEPDLVIANKEENRREDIEALEQAGLTVCLTDPNTVDEAVTMVADIGRALGAEARARELTGEIAQALEDGIPAGEVAVYTAVWHNPMMGLGSNTYGDSLLAACGARNVLSKRERYPATSMQEVRELRPDLVLLPDEPFPFDEQHAALYGQIAPARVLDGKLLWWYGPRMPAAIRMLRRLVSGAKQGDTG